MENNPPLTDNGRRLHTLLPAPERAAPPQPQQLPNIGTSKGPRVGACNTCRNRKIKCNGQRPTCDKCTTADTQCIYSETESREAKRKYFELRDRRNTHEEMIELLKSLPETDALDVLRQLKSGKDVKSILDSARDGDLLMRLSSPQRRDGRCALSFIADLPDAQDRGSSESADGARRDSESVASTSGSNRTDRSSLI